MAPNWVVLDGFEDFKVSVAAYLWVYGEPPEKLELFPDDLVVSKMMTAIEQKTGAYRGDSIYVGGRSDLDRALDDFMGRPQKPDHLNCYPIRVTRSALIKIAEELGQKPAFLYPESRGASPSKPKFDTRKLNSFLKLTEALLIELGKKTSPQKYLDQLGLGSSKVTSDRDICLLAIADLLERLNMDPAEWGLATKLSKMVAVKLDGETLGRHTIGGYLKEIQDLKKRD